MFCLRSGGDPGEQRDLRCRIAHLSSRRGSKPSRAYLDGPRPDHQQVTVSEPTSATAQPASLRNGVSPHASSRPATFSVTASVRNTHARAQNPCSTPGAPQAPVTLPSISPATIQRRGESQVRLSPVNVAAVNCQRGSVRTSVWVHLPARVGFVWARQRLSRRERRGAAVFEDCRRLGIAVGLRPTRRYCPVIDRFLPGRIDVEPMSAQRRCSGQADRRKPGDDDRPYQGSPYRTECVRHRIDPFFLSCGPGACAGGLLSPQAFESSFSLQVRRSPAPGCG